MKVHLPLPASCIKLLAVEKDSPGSHLRREVRMQSFSFYMSISTKIVTDRREDTLFFSQEDPGGRGNLHEIDSLHVFYLRSIPKSSTSTYVRTWMTVPLCSNPNPWNRKSGSSQNLKRKESITSTNVKDRKSHNKRTLLRTISKVFAQKFCANNCANNCAHKKCYPSSGPSFEALEYFHEMKHTPM